MTKNIFFTSSKNNFIKFLNNFPVINPHGYIRICIEIIISLLTILNLIIIPIQLAFNLDFYNEIEIISNYKIKNLRYLNLIFFIEILLNFLTCYYEEGVLIKKR